MIFECKKDIDLNDLKIINPALLIIFTHTVMYCHEYNLPMKITSLISDRGNVLSVSKTHGSGRAMDLSVMGWTEQHIHRFVFITNRFFSDIAARSYSDNEPRAVIYHNYEKQGAHLHIQVSPHAKISRFVDFN